MDFLDRVDEDFFDCWVDCLDRVDLDVDDFLVEMEILEVETDSFDSVGISINCSDVVTKMLSPAFTV